MFVWLTCHAFVETINTLCMRDDRDYKLDLSSTHTEAKAASSTPRPYLSVRFSCCNVYVRIYRSPDGSSYRGRCPRCGKPVNFIVGRGGTDSRFFVVE